MLLTAKYTPPKRNLESEMASCMNKIAETLVSQGFEEKIAERIAFSGSKNLLNAAKDFILLTPVSFHLVPKGLEWAVIAENGKELFLDEDYNIVLAQARQLAKKNKLKLVLHSEDGWAKDSESFQVNRPFFSES